MRPTHGSLTRGVRVILPALLLTVSGGAFAGLALQPADPQQLTAAAQLPPVALSAPSLTPSSIPSITPSPLSPEREIGLQRASRSRAAASPSPEPPPPPPSPEPPPPPPAPVAPPAPPARTTFCPVPSASFTDTWGAARSGGRSHKGTDLMARHGAAVLAVTAGVVDTTSSANGGVSLYLRARNGDRFFYAHNAENVVRDGSRVEAGQLIARVGNSGNARGGAPHVHFEMQPGGGAAVNPYRFLRGLCG